MTIKLKPKGPATGNEALVDVPSHTLATGAGAIVGGIAAGAVVGTAAGPVGTVIGAVAGAVAGGLGADAAANAVDQIGEDAHWRKNYLSRPYVDADSTFEDFGPAYTFGVVSYTRNPGRSFDDMESDLSDAWYAERGPSTLDWGHASPATRDAWDRVATGGERRQAER